MKIMAKPLGEAYANWLAGAALRETFDIQAAFTPAPAEAQRKRQRKDCHPANFAGLYSAITRSLPP